jgi:hypothetical protein
MGHREKLVFHRDAIAGVRSKCESPASRRALSGKTDPVCLHGNQPSPLKSPVSWIDHWLGTLATNAVSLTLEASRLLPGAHLAPEATRKSADALRCASSAATVEASFIGQCWHARRAHTHIAAMKEWLAAADITEGALFRRVGKGGSLIPGRLTSQSVALIVKACAVRLRLDPDAFSASSRPRRRPRRLAVQDDGREPAQVG